MICPSCGTAAPVGARFCPGCGHGLAATSARADQRRLVTVLFADLVGYTKLAEARDPEQVKNMVDRCFQQLAADVVAHGGRVDKIVGDAIMALFGAPLAHEDDAERAVRAGLQMQRTLADWSEPLGVDIRMRVGINSGEVLVGEMRAGGDYTAMGDVVNTASRLQTTAEPGQVLVGQQTHAATRDVVRYRFVGQVRARGREEAVPAWVALEAVLPPGQRPRRARTPLIGREAELGLLRHALGVAAERRRAQIVVLSGEAGTGKTRLAEELVALARAERHAIVFEGRCLPYGEANVWWPLADALRRSVGVTPADDHLALEEKGRKTIAALLGEAEDSREVERVVRGLSYILDQGTRTDVEPARARDEAVRSMQVCVERLTVERPLVFVVSELHWADDLLLEFLDRLLDGVQQLPVLLLATTRPELAERWHPAFGHHNQIMLHIDPLGPSATADLLCELLTEPASDELRGVLVERSGGNPLYLEELVALLARDQPFDELPVTLRGLVAARLDGLGARERSTLEDAAVIGRSGSLAALEGMAESDDGGSAVRAALATLVGLDLLTTADTGEGCAGWEFRSELVREVAYAIVSKAERARRHAVLAEWLAAAAAGTGLGSDDLDQVAYHFGTAAELVVELDGVPGVPADLGANALKWVGRAAEHAESTELWPAAAALLDQALRLAVFGDAETRARLVLARARARIGMRDVAGAAIDLADATDAAKSGNDPSVNVHVLTLTGELERIEGRMDVSEATLGQAVALARQLGDDQARADALRALGQTRLFAGDESGADDASVEALAAYRNLGDRRGEAWALQSLAWTAFLRGDFGPAEDRLHASADAFSEIGDWGGHAWAMGLLGWVRFGQGHLDEAEDIARRSLADTHTGDQWALGMMTVLLASVSLWKGHASEAADLARAARAAFRELPDPWAEIQAVAPLARSLLALGRIEEGRSLLEELLEASGASEPRMRRLARFAVSTALTHQLGEGAAVLEMARDMVEVWSGEFIAEQRAVYGLALLQSGQVEDGVAALEAAVDPHGRTSPPFPKGALVTAGTPQPNFGVMLAFGYLAAGRTDAAAAALAYHSGPELGTYVDRAWAAVARSFVALARGDGAALSLALADGRAIVDATEDRLAQATVRLAQHVALSAAQDAGLTSLTPVTPERAAVEAHDRLTSLGVGLPGWEQVFRMVAGQSSSSDAIAVAN